MEVATAVALGTSALSAKASYETGKAEQRGYDLQAEQADLRGRSEALGFKQKGADALGRLNETLAAIISRAAAGGVDATSGSAATMQQFAMGQGVDEFNIAADNAAMAIGQASEQAYIYKSAGETAKYRGKIEAISTLGQAAYTAGQL